MESLIVKTCISCNNNFTTDKVHKYKSTCSKKCQYQITAKKLREYGESTITCKQCGKEHKTKLSSNKLFCSNKCRILWMKDNWKGEGNPAWKPMDLKRDFRRISSKIRKEFFTEQGHCSLCPSNKDLEIHHIDKNQKNNERNNLLLLCNKCHAKQHKGEKAYHLILGHKNHKRNPIKCKTCNKEIIPYFTNQKFCSRSCAGKHNFAERKDKPKRNKVEKTKTICLFCEKEFEHIRCHHYTFCSKTCYHQWKRNKPKNYRANQ